MAVLLLRFGYLVNYHRWLLWEKISGRQIWTNELAEYFKISSQQVLKNYQQKKQFAKRLWRQKPRNTILKKFSFYSETDYFIYRQKWFNRHKAFFDIAFPFWLKRSGLFCEYGSGIGPVTAWLLKLFPNWNYTLVDLNCPVFDFAKWRFRNHQQVDFKTVTTAKPPLTKKYDVITCKQVFEHVPNALELAHHLVDHLNSKGWLYLDYIYEPGQENLAVSAQQRRQVLAYLQKALKPIFAIKTSKTDEGYGLYLKS